MSFIKRLNKEERQLIKESEKCAIYHVTKYDSSPIEGTKYGTKLKPVEVFSFNSEDKAIAKLKELSRIGYARLWETEGCKES